MKKYKIIAELAQGYEGKVYLAEQMIESAKIAGAHFAKIQVVYADELSTKDYKDYKIFKSLELNKNEWKKIFQFSKKKKINLITEVFGKKSIDVCKFIKAKFIKIHPTDINNFYLIDKIKNLNPEKIFIGIGGSTKDEIEKCLFSLKNYDVVLLHGHQSLPTPNKDINISRLSTLKEILMHKKQKVSLGIADHVLPGDHDHNLIVAMAISAGATYIEKHLTTNRIFKLEDYHSALNPDEFKIFCKKISHIVEIFGKGDFLSSASEKKYRLNTRRSYLSKKKIKKNEIFNNSNLIAKRTNFHSDIKDINKILGKKAKINIKTNKIIYKKLIK